jgi:hypothetical protein
MQAASCTCKGCKRTFASWAGLRTHRGRGCGAEEDAKADPPPDLVSDSDTDYDTDSAESDQTDHEKDWGEDWPRSDPDQMWGSLAEPVTELPGEPDQVCQCYIENLNIVIMTPDIHHMMSLLCKPKYYFAFNDIMTPNIRHNCNYCVNPNIISRGMSL